MGVANQRRRRLERIINLRESGGAPIKVRGARERGAGKDGGRETRSCKLCDVNDRDRDPPSPSVTQGNVRSSHALLPARA